MGTAQHSFLQVRTAAFITDIYTDSRTAPQNKNKDYVQY